MGIKLKIVGVFFAAFVGASIANNTHTTTYIIKKHNISQVVSQEVIKTTDTLTPTVAVLAAEVIAPTPITQNVIMSYIDEKFGGNASTAKCIAYHESGFRPNAAHQNYDAVRSWDVGVFQVNLYWHPQYTWDEMADWKTNIDAAYLISDGGTSWSLWSTKRYCV